MADFRTAESIKNITVVGSGTIGASWAALFMAHGHNVVVCDPAENAQALTRQQVEQAWPSLVTLHQATAEIPWHRLSFNTSLESALSQAHFVQENAPEREDFKIALFKRMDAILPEHVLIASSSSGLLMSRLQSQCQYPGRCVIGHPFNPPHLIPLVEVVGGKSTSPAAIEHAMAFYRSVGKHPIKINKEVAGHIANRLQAAVWREAIYLALENVASVEDIDAAISQGPGIRWAVLGPHMTFHLGGGQGGMPHFMEHLLAPVQSWWDDLGNPVLSPQNQQRLIDGVMQASHGQSIDSLASKRDKLITQVLLAKSRQDPPAPAG